jgi:hypothetical protein
LLLGKCTISGIFHFSESLPDCSHFPDDCKYLRKHSSLVADIPNWVLHVSSIAILLSWTELMLLIGRLPTYGYYALMFSAVLQNVIRVILDE